MTLFSINELFNGTRRCPNRLLCIVWPRTCRPVQVSLCPGPSPRAWPVPADHTWSVVIPRGALASDQHNVSSHPHTGPGDITPVLEHSLSFSLADSSSWESPQNEITIWWYCYKPDLLMIKSLPDFLKQCESLYARFSRAIMNPLPKGRLQKKM